MDYIGLWETEGHKRYSTQVSSKSRKMNATFGEHLTWMGQALSTSYDVFCHKMQTLNAARKKPRYTQKLTQTGGKTVDVLVLLFWVFVFCTYSPRKHGQIMKFPHTDHCGYTDAECIICA